MKQNLLLAALGLSLALSPLVSEAQPKDTKKPVATPVPAPTPVPTPTPIPVTSPPQSSSGGSFSLSWGEPSEEKPVPAGNVRLTWGPKSEKASASVFGGLTSSERERSRIVIVFVTVFKKLPLIRRIDFDARRLQVEKKRAEHKAKHKK